MRYALLLSLLLCAEAIKSAKCDQRCEDLLINAVKGYYDKRRGCLCIVSATDSIEVITFKTTQKLPDSEE